MKAQNIYNPYGNRNQNFQGGGQQSMMPPASPTPTTASSKTWLDLVDQLGKGEPIDNAEYMSPVSLESFQGGGGWVPFSNMKTKPTKQTKDRFRDNKDMFNLRSFFDKIASSKEFKDSVPDAAVADVDYSGIFNAEEGPALPQGACAGGNCGAYDVDSKELGDMASGESDEPDINMFRGMANFIGNMKDMKQDRLTNRIKRLNKPWRQGLGSRETGLVMENPLNNWRQKKTNTQLAKLNARHTGNNNTIYGSF